MANKCVSDEAKAKHEARQRRRSLENEETFYADTGNGPFPAVFAREEVSIESREPSGVVQKVKTISWTRQTSDGEVTWERKTEKMSPDGGPPEISSEREETKLRLGDE